MAALATVNVGRGAEAGLAIVLLAIFLDRLTAALGTPANHKSSLIALWKKSRANRAGVAEAT